ncbi:MAG TPA: undecaprenyldiphospho-muramoylpentapeptide beta-N-acetylglucosaminyltransferase [Geobacteraceae bacterium]|nr:undecaprenyldiphospho-muramoylpentapeptide beta-N-acetylglucosaminyltransferase [Geobacteraceae bacterium]
MKLLIAGGGTGGHLFPGIAVAEEFLSRDPANEVLFVGTERGVESKVLPQLGYRLQLISASGVRGKGASGLFTGLGRFLYSYSQSRQILKDFAPDMVLGVGGYASAPVLMAARGMLIPRFVHEQNAYPGMANKVLSRFAAEAYISLEESTRFFPKGNTVLTGNPLRRQILDVVAAAEKGEGESDTESGEFNLLVFGGSLGAHSINMAMVAAAPLLARLGGRFSVTHQTGEKDRDEVAAAYEAAGITAEVLPFINDMAAAYRQADLVVCRAGATTIAEVTACGKPCLFIPYPHAVDDHQRRNAEALLKKGAGEMLLERELSPLRLVETIESLSGDRAKLKLLGGNARALGRTDAGKVIVDRMMAVTGSGLRARAKG